MITPNEDNEARERRVLEEYARLAALGLPLYPVDRCKLPIGKWALGAVNYVMTPMDRDEAERRAKSPRVVGWAVLCGNPAIKVFTLDVERAGMDQPDIVSVVESIPAYAKRPSPSGGVHACFIVIDGDPVPTGVLARLDGVLLAEIRGVGKKDASNGSYAVITGPGRGPLSPNFEPMRVTFSQAQDFLNPIRKLHQPSDREIRINANKEKSAYCGTGVRSGTGGLISQALEDGSLNWLDLLDEGWTDVNLDIHREGFLRPSYGPDDQPTSQLSANATDNVLVVHSSAVPWADPCEVFNPPQAFAAAHFDADFAAAMSAVESAAASWVESEQQPSGILLNWPMSLLEDVYRSRKRDQRDYMAESETVPGEFQRPLIRVLGRDDLRNLPKPEPLIDKTLDRSTVALLVGPPGSYKSFVALDWACSVATGTPWQGRPTKKGHVVYIAGEGAYGLNQRISAWEAHHNIKVPNELLTVIHHPVQLGRPDELAALIEVIKSKPTVMVISDTLARCAAGLDENAAKDMGLVIDAATRLRDCTDNGVVVLVHHTGKDGKTIRGSSALEGGVDTIYAAKVPATLHLILDRRKRKDGPEPDVMHLEATQPSFGNSLVLVSNGLSNVSGNQEKILFNLQSKQEGTKVTARVIEDETGLGRSSVHAALKGLVNSGLVDKDTTAKPNLFSLAVAV